MSATLILNYDRNLFAGWASRPNKIEQSITKQQRSISEIFSRVAADAFLGPVCDYVIAPVARYAGVWHIPVLTAGAQADAFRHKDEHYPTLTRMMGSHRLVGEALRHILRRFGWKIVGLLYHNHGVASSKGNSECHFTLGAVFTALNQPVHKSFNQETTTVEDYRNLLTFVSKSARSKFA